jgi:flagellar motor switch protein FliN/FliY
MNTNLEVPPNLDILLDVPVTLTVELGSCQLPMRDVLQLAVGSIVQLDKPAGTPVELRANHKLVARGEVVLVEDHLGIRITELANSVNQPPAASPKAVANAPAATVPA